MKIFSQCTECGKTTIVCLNDTGMLQRSSLLTWDGLTTKWHCYNKGCSKERTTHRRYAMPDGTLRVEQ